MAEQFLQTSQVSAIRQHMRRKTVPQRMRRHGVRQLKFATQATKLPLRHARIQNAPARADDAAVPSSD